MIPRLTGVICQKEMAQVGQGLLLSMQSGHVLFKFVEDGSKEPSSLSEYVQQTVIRFELRDKKNWGLNKACGVCKNIHSMSRGIYC